MNKKIIIFLISLLVAAPATIMAQKGNGYGNTARYAKDNAQLPKVTKKDKRVVFLGNSITEGWVRKHPDFFKRTGYIGRGISGQTSYNFLLRFRDDVINLNPALVVINVGTNDVAENSCPYDENTTMSNLISMVELAKVNKIKVILTSVLPAAGFGWRPNITDAPQKIASLNRRIQQYAKEKKIPYVDYFSSMVDTDGISLKKAFSTDNPGVHPNADGYDVMEAIIEPAIKKAL